MRGLHKKLINMGDAFQIFYDMGQHRSLPDLIKRLEKTHPEQVPSLSTLKKWHKEDEWKLQCMMMDKEIRDGVKEKMMPEWIEVKVTLLKTFMNQIKKAKEADITPENTRDLVAASKEIRALMGEGDHIDVKGSMDVVSIYLPDNKRDDDKD
jgi:hypothetical protein